MQPRIRPSPGPFGKLRGKAPNFHYQSDCSTDLQCDIELEMPGKQRRIHLAGMLFFFDLAAVFSNEPREDDGRRVTRRHPDTYRENEHPRIAPAHLGSHGNLKKKKKIVFTEDKFKEDKTYLDLSSRCHGFK